MPDSLPMNSVPESTRRPCPRRSTVADRANADATSADPTRRALLSCIAVVPAAMALPAVHLAVDGDDADLLALVAQYHQHADNFDAVFLAKESGLATEDDVTACREQNEKLALQIAAIPALTMAGIMAKTRIALEAITHGSAEWDEPIAFGLLADMDRMRSRMAS